MEEIPVSQSEQFKNAKIQLSKMRLSYLPGLRQTRHSDVTESHDDGKERVEILVIFAAVATVHTHIAVHL